MIEPARDVSREKKMRERKMSNKRAWRVGYWRNTFRAVSEHFKNVPSINPENGWVSRWSRRFGSKHSVVESIVKSPIILHVVVHRLIRNKHRTFVRELMRFRQSPGLRENKEWRGLSFAVYYYTRSRHKPSLFYHPKVAKAQYPHIMPSKILNWKR